MKDWELNADWEKSLIVDKAINFYGQKQQSRLEKNLAAFKKQGKKVTIEVEKWFQKIIDKF